MNNRKMSYLEEAMLKLSSNTCDMFYNYMFSFVDRMHSKSVPTMGVGIHDGRLTLAYNEDFNKHIVDTHSVDHLATILKHEAAHITHLHCIKMKDTDVSERKRKNVAMDVVVNQLLNIDHIKDIGGWTLENFAELCHHYKGTILADQALNYYMTLLNQEKQARQEEDKQNGNSEQSDDFDNRIGDHEIDSHDMFKEVDQLERSMMDSYMERAAEKTRQRGGNVPSDIEDYLKMLKKPVISWEREIKHFVGSSMRSERKLTRSRLNRRYGIKVQGHKKSYKARILTVLDTSGSMSGSRTDKALNEIYGIYKALGTEIDIVECDCKISNVFSYKGSDKYVIKGRGGTDMKPALEYAKEQKYDGVIVITDGEFYEELDSNYPIRSLWIITENSSFTSSFGKTLHIEDYE